MSEEQTTEQEQAAPATPEEAWDTAVAALDEQQHAECKTSVGAAVRAGMPTPPPPGFTPPTPDPVDDSVAEAERAQAREDIEAKIIEAQAAGDWTASFALKSQLLDQRYAEERRPATFHGWDGR